MPQTLTIQIDSIPDLSHVYENVISVSGTHTIQGGVLILCDTSGGGFTVTLPPAGLTLNRKLIIKNTGANTLTVDGDGSETIDGALTETLSTQYEVLTIVSDGSTWHIENKQVPAA